MKKATVVIPMPFVMLKAFVLKVVQSTRVIVSKLYFCENSILFDASLSRIQLSFWNSISLINILSIYRISMSFNLLTIRG